MNIRLLIGMGIVAAVSACGAGTDEVSDAAGFEVGELSPQARPAKAPQLNLSHIECTEEGTVLAHFVLLFAGSGTPGSLTGTYNGGSFGPVAPGKNTGNVWHYNVILPAGDIEILSATVTTAAGVEVSLHNPSEYSGDYQCDDVEECPVVVTPGFYCFPALGNPGSECGQFGLLPQGKDDDLSGTTFPASQDAYVAIVKSGAGGCPNGQVSYQVYVGVSAGDILSTTNGQDISHVTYCACPDQ